jgi:hypothetical protein
VRGHRDADRRVDPRQLFHRQHIRERVGAAAPVLLRERDPHQAEAAELLDDLVGEGLGAVEVTRNRRDLGAGELADGFAQQALLVGEVEVHTRENTECSFGFRGDVR